MVKISKKLDKVKEMARKIDGRVSIKDLEAKGMTHKEAITGLKEYIEYVDKKPYCGYKYSSTEDGTVIWYTGVDQATPERHLNFWNEVRAYTFLNRGKGFGVSKFHEEHPHKFYGTCETLWGYTFNRRNYLLLVYDYKEVFIPKYQDALPISKDTLAPYLKDLRENVLKERQKEVDKLSSFLNTLIDKYFGV